MLTPFSMRFRQQIASLRKHTFIPSRLTLSLIRVFVVVALLALLVGQARSAYAIGCSVMELISAMNAANASAGDDIIELASGCTYTLTAVHNTNAAGANGLPAVLQTSVSGKLTINGNGATIARSSAGGTPNFRIFFVYNGADLTLNRLHVTNGNIPTEGGGAIFSNGTVLINEVRLTSNSGAAGGAVWNAQPGLFTALSSEISGNTASSYGGAFGNLNGAVNMINSTISGNSALGTTINAGGGAIDSYGATPSVYIGNSTVVNNTAVAPNAARSGIWIETGYITIRNSIIANNNGTNNCQISADIFTDNTANLENGTSCNFVGVVGGNINPLLGPLANNGGFTQTHALLTGSPAINMGINFDANNHAGAPLTTDQRGTGFTRTNAGRVDIGAYESTCNSFPYTVPAGNTAALINAIACANGTPSNDVITLTNSTYTLRTVNQLHYGEDPVGLPVIINAATAGTLTINGVGAIIERGGIPVPPAFRLLYVENDGVLTLNGLILRGGASVGPNYSNGGAIASSGYLTLNNSIVTNSQAERGGGGIWSNGTLALNNTDVTNNSANFGGGIVNENTLSITNTSLLDSNTAVDGGGIYNWVGGIVTVNNSTISNNEATGGHGGGIMTEENGTVNVTNASVISGNESGEQGGGIYVGSSDTATVNNSTIANNSSVETGGGIYNLGSLTVTNSTLSGNETAVRGGGIFNNSPNMKVSNSTITGNTAVGFTTGIGGGIDSEYDSYSVIVTNSTIARNTARDVGAVYAVKMTFGSNIIGENTAIGGIPGGFGINEQDGVFASMGYNVFSALSGGFTGALAFDLYDAAASPLNLGPLANNGGPTQTIALGAGSVALGHGMCQWTPVGIIDVATDQRGTNRDTPCDSGAYEAGNTAPTISNIADRTINTNSSTGAIAFTIGDAETAPGSLTLSPGSSNTTLVPLANIVFGGAGAARTVTVTPAAGQTGTATITVTVSDGALSASDPFVLTVVVPPDAIFSNGFESGNLNGWTLSATDGGDLSATAAAALMGTRGLQALIDDANALYVGDDTPVAEPRYRARFMFDPNSVVMANNDNFSFFFAFRGAATAMLQAQLRINGGAYQVRFGAIDNGVMWYYTPYATITDAPHMIELDWLAASADGANNGTLNWWIDEVAQTAVTALDNDTQRVDRVRLGAVAGVDAGTSGTVYFDAFVSRRSTYIGRLIAPPVLNSPPDGMLIPRETSPSLGWASVAGATQYYAEFTNGTTVNLNSGWQVGTSWASGLQPQGVYTWRVKTRNAAGEDSAFSAPRTLTVRPGVPTNLQGSAVSSTRVNLTWTASVDAPAGIVRYRILRGGVQIGTSNNVTPSFADTSAPACTANQYKVRSDNGTVTSLDSNVITVNTPCDGIFNDGFESGNLNAWTLSATDGGNLSVTAAASLTNTRGMQAFINDLNALYVGDDTPVAEPRYRARFYFDPNGVAMANNDNFSFFFAFQSSSTAMIQAQIRRFNSTYQVRIGAMDDNSVWFYTPYATISDATHIIELDWQAATAVGANNGTLNWWIDEVVQTAVTALDNDTRRVDRVRLGAVAGMDAGTSGTIYFDAYVSARTTYIGPELGGLGGFAAPSVEPTEEIKPEATDEPTVEPTAEVTPEATDEPTVEVTPEATVEPTIEPTALPTEEPTAVPIPTETPTPEPTLLPFSVPVYQTMDDGAPLWSASSGWHLGADAAYSGLGWGALASGQMKTLALNVPVNLAGAALPTLSFQSKLVSGVLPEVRVSLDGVTWQTVAVVTPSLNWALATVDLSAYAGQTIRLQFVWASPARAADTWQVDEVTLADGALLPPVEPTATATLPASGTEPNAPIPTVAPRDGGLPDAPVDLPPTG